MFYNQQSIVRYLTCYAILRSENKYVETNLALLEGILYQMSFLKVCQISRENLHCLVKNTHLCKWGDLCYTEPNETRQSIYTQRLRINDL